MKTLLAAIIISLCLNLIAAPAWAKGDSTVYYYNENWETCPKENASYYRTSRKEGALFIVKDYFKSGVLQMTGAFEDDSFKTRSGPFFYYNEQSAIVEKERYINGKNTGKREKWSKETGLKILEENYDVVGRLFGAYRSWYDSGIPQTEAYYKDGKLEGHARWFYPSGKLSEESDYKDDKSIRTDFWNEDGSTDPNGVDGDVLPSFRTPEYPSVAAYISAKINYPAKARRKGIEGKTIVEFIVDERGKVRSPILLRSTNYMLDAEALRVVASMPDWKPGMSHHLPVKVWYSLPITFSLKN